MHLNRRRRKLLLTALFCLVTSRAFAEKPIVNGKIERIENPFADDLGEEDSYEIVVDSNP